MDTEAMDTEAMDTEAMDIKARLAKRNAELALHDPWNRWTEAERQAHLAMGGGRPIRWTTNLSLKDKVDERGFVFVYAGGPLEGAVNSEPRKRADGKVDGRSKGVRKCSRCGQTGHNARTCRGTPKASAPAPVVRENAPATRPTLEHRPEMRASVKVPGKKTCGKCGLPGHNARTCGRVQSAMSAAPKASAPAGAAAAGKFAKTGKTGRLNTCGKCGGKGHNARTCKG